MIFPTISAWLLAFLGTRTSFTHRTNIIFWGLHSIVYTMHVMLKVNIKKLFCVISFCAVTFYERFSSCDRFEKFLLNMNRASDKFAELLKDENGWGSVARVSMTNCSASTRKVASPEAALTWFYFSIKLRHEKTFSASSSAKCQSRTSHYATERRKSINREASRIKKLLHVIAPVAARNQVHRAETIPPCHCFSPFTSVIIRSQTMENSHARKTFQNRKKVLDAGESESIIGRTMLYRLMKGKQTENSSTSWTISQPILILVCLPSALDDNKKLLPSRLSWTRSKVPDASGAHGEEDVNLRPRFGRRTGSTGFFSEPCRCRHFGEPSTFVHRPSAFAIPVCLEKSCKPD